MKLPKSVVAAINAYYAFQAKPVDGWKDVCLKEIDRCCTKHEISLCAAAGTFFLAKGKQTAQISRPILPNQNVVKSEKVKENA